MAIDSCITDIFSEANATSDSGSVGSPHYTGYILTEGDAAGSPSGGGGAITGNLTSGGQFVAGPGANSSGTVLLTITGTWVGFIQITQSFPNGGVMRVFTSNVSDEIIFGTPNLQYTAYTGLGGLSSGTAVVTFNAAGNRIKILAASSFVGYLKLE